ncbi:MAG: hypothetical protein CMF69_03160 [Magnetovibrio sp.]|nr:hypothetical protein [Magnetovibrio sp.]|tara:strand:- start:387 stop:1304 length:918 start_codon:yes stop_codon:yes gene_type:complete
MSIRINKITRGRFGNKVFQYNNLVQLANNLGVEASCVLWEGNEYFKNIILFKKSNRKPRILYWNEILEKTDKELKVLLKNQDLALDDPSYALHNTFYRLTNKDPREFLELKEEYVPKLENDKYTYVGIHIRGGDILGSDGNDGREIHTSTYYKKSIDYLVKNHKLCKFIVCTDDMSFQSFKETIAYLKVKNYNYELGPNCGQKKFINDFAILCYCDILINSSSTFCCACVFIGKKNKKVIHSKDWMNRIVKGDFSNGEYKKYVRKWTYKMSDTEFITTEGYNKAKYFWFDIYEKKVNYYNNIIFI